MGLADKDMLACSESAWDGDGRRCRWCNAELTGRRQRWCSDDCASAYGKQHWWASASREAARLADWTCQRCGRRSGAGARDRRGRPLRFQTHHRIPLQTLVHGKDSGNWWLKGLRIRHADSGCHHHLAGLEFLCADCHHDEHHGSGDGQLAIRMTA